MTSYPHRGEKIPPHTKKYPPHVGILEIVGNTISIFCDFWGIFVWGEYFLRGVKKYPPTQKIPNGEIVVKNISGQNFTAKIHYLPRYFSLYISYFFNF